MNSPYEKEESSSYRFFTSFSERPKTLDPARAYSANEYEFIAQILEPPLQYHYLKRPYQLVPLGLSKMPIVRYLDNNGKILPDAARYSASYTEYVLTVKPARPYAPHPGFAKDKKGHYLYHALHQHADINTLSDFKITGTRAVTAEDYVYQIKRLADPKNRSPVLSIMDQYIVGLKALADELEKMRKKEKGFIDLRQIPLSGVQVIDDNTFSIRVKGLYPQLKYWLAMPFFAPTPWEIDKFYSQSILQENNISFDWYPIGSGPYMLSINNPNRLMKLVRNPNFAGETYPTDGSESDARAGFMHLAGRALPFIDEVWFYLEKESIPRWAKFLQGYYDRSGISSDSFDQAIKVQADGEPVLSQEMQQKNIRLDTEIAPSIFYLGFNMLNERIGGYTESQALLRQALSIAIDFEEFISIFMNGRGSPAQGPIPPGIFGYSDHFNSYVYNRIKGHLKRKSIDEAKLLLARAGYKNGIDPKTMRPLVINLDITGSNGPDDKARFDWFRKQFRKIGIDLHIRATQYNRFQDKLRTGSAEIFFMGWNADYPDPENFLFLLYGPNSKVRAQGENVSNYSNKIFDMLFEKMRTMEDTPERMAIIQRMMAIVQHDAPWVFGFYPKNFVLSHTWLTPLKINAMANNTLKYQAIQPERRVQLQSIWNQPVLWPLGFIIFLLFVMAYPVIIVYRRKEHTL